VSHHWLGNRSDIWPVSTIPKSLLFCDQPDLE